MLLRSCCYAFSAPFPSINDGTAVRWFKAFCSQSQEVNPTDLDLYRLGVLDQKTGEIAIDGKPEFIFRISEVESDG